MASIAAAASACSSALAFLPFQFVSSQRSIGYQNGWDSTNLKWFRCNSRRLRWNGGRSRGLIVVIRASGVDALDSSGSNGNARRDFEVDRNGLSWGRKSVNSFREMVNAMPPAVLAIKRISSPKLVIGLSIVVAILVIAARQIMLKKNNRNYHGSVADLVRRGQLRADRRIISKPLKYEDPFNNPFMKIDKSSATIEVFGKVYRLAPVTLTKEQQSVHQKRRSRAYQWKRPTVFLKEGDAIPPDVDPDSVRWIPANHPFATTISDIDEDLAQNNVYQKDGVPFRVRAEHEAMQKKILSLQTEARSSMKPNEKSERDSSANQQNVQKSNGVDISDSFSSTSSSSSSSSSSD